MRSLVALVLTLWCVSAAFAAGKPSVIVFAAGTTGSAATTMNQRADYVALSLTITSDERDPEKQYAELSQAVRSVKIAAKENPKIDMHAGPAYLSADPKANSKFSSSYQNFSQAQLHLLAALTPGDDVYACAAMLQRFVRALVLPGKTKLSIGQINLAVKNPEQYRDQLLKMISDAVKKEKDAFGQGASVSIKIDGLDNPVSVRQLDDEHVELSIDHSIHMEVKH